VNSESVEHGQVGTPNGQGAATRVADVGDEIELNFVDTVRRVIRARRALLVFTLAGCMLGMVIALTWPRWYEAQAVFLPPESPETAIPTQSLLLKQDPSDMYLGMLSSRSVSDFVIDHVGLMNVYRAKMRSDARAALLGNSKFLISKNKLISVTVTARQPKLAADIANAYLDALYYLNGTMVSSASEHRRVFFEEQLESQKNSLSEAEVELKKAEEETGITLPEGEAQAGLRATADLQANINAAEARLSAIQVGATDQNPRVIEAQAQIAELKAQLVRQQANGKARLPGTGLASSAELPKLELEYLRKVRDVKLRELLYTALTQQYEKARIGSLDPGPQLQIVDRAIMPERKAGPPRKWIIVGGAILGFFIGLAYLLFADPLKRLIHVVSSDPIRPTGE
jgi:tyrosine-protein kinase Etk/Wzc